MADPINFADYAKPSDEEAPFALSTDDAASYIHDMLRSLQTLAGGGDMQVLHKLIGCAAEEAERLRQASGG